MESFYQTYLPDHLQRTHVALFTSVINTDAIRSRVISAATGTVEDQENVNFAFVNAKLVTSGLHLQTAILQACQSAAQDTLRTKTVHSEILWALCPTNNISDALRQYGLSSESTALFVIRIGGSGLVASEIQSRMEAIVEGELVSLQSLEMITDWNAIKKYYKLNEEVSVKQAESLEQQKALIDGIVTSSVAMKAVMA